MSEIAQDNDRDWSRGTKMTNYEVHVLVDGKRVTKYNANGDVYLEGRPGSSYELELVNKTNTDAEFIVSVDGLSIVDGKPAGTQSTGYIVRAYRTDRIKGWKVNSDTAAEFKFGAKSKSYANLSHAGDVQNAGVIGLQVFPRKYVAPVYPPVYNNGYHPFVDPWYNQEYTSTWKSASPMRGIAPQSFNNVAMGSAATSRSAAVEDSLMTFGSSLGTEFGEATKFTTTTVDFQRASTAPQYQTVMYYGDAKDLNKLGIVLDWQASKQVKPQAFPADSCVPPVGWRK